MFDSINEGQYLQAVSTDNAFSTVPAGQSLQNRTRMTGNIFNLIEFNHNAGCLFPRGPAGITRRKSEEGHRKYRMKITHFGANLKVDHLGSNHQAKRCDLLPICLSPCIAQL